MLVDVNLLLEAPLGVHQRKGLLANVNDDNISHLRVPSQIQDRVRLQNTVAAHHSRISIPNPSTAVVHQAWAGKPRPKHSLQA
jgi:hypothetical protein